jgi:hypothetical protein
VESDAGRDPDRQVQVARSLVDDELQELVQFDRHGISLVSETGLASSGFMTGGGRRNPTRS